MEDALKEARKDRFDGKKFVKVTKQFTSKNKVKQNGEGMLSL